MYKYSNNRQKRDGTEIRKDRYYSITIMSKKKTNNAILFKGFRAYNPTDKS